MDEFVIRNLVDTVEFLTRIGIQKAVKIDIDSKIQRAITLQNQASYQMAYLSLLCRFSNTYKKDLAFCSCCDAVKNFIRNYSLLKFMPSSTTYQVFMEKNTNEDLFYEYLIALSQKNIPMMKKVIKKNPLFWEAYIAIADMVTEYTTIDGDLSDYFYMYLKIEKGFDCINTSMDIVPFDPLMIYGLRFIPRIEDPNLIAGYLYSAGYFGPSSYFFQRMILGYSHQQSLSSHLMKFCTIPESDSPECTTRNIVEYIFKTNGMDPCKDFHTIPGDARYFYMWMTYLHRRDPGFFEQIFPILNSGLYSEPDSLMINSIYYYHKKEYYMAERFIRKALRISTRPDLRCIYGHILIKLNKNDNACNQFNQVVKLFPCNFRLIYDAAFGMFNIGLYEKSLFYARKAVEFAEDKTIWRLIGALQLELDQPANALYSLKKATELGDHEALLPMAETYRQLGQETIGIELYEKYVIQQGINKRAIAKYLFDYYEELNDIEKSQCYKKLYEKFLETEPDTKLDTEGYSGSTTDRGLP